MRTSVSRRSMAESSTKSQLDLGGPNDHVAKVFQQLGAVAVSHKSKSKHSRS